MIVRTLIVQNKQTNSRCNKAIPLRPPFNRGRRSRSGPFDDGHLINSEQEHGQRTGNSSASRRDVRPRLFYLSRPATDGSSRRVARPTSRESRHNRLRNSPTWLDMKETRPGGRMSASGPRECSFDRQSTTVLDGPGSLTQVEPRMANLTCVDRPDRFLGRTRNSFGTAFDV